ncbi:MAG: YlxR family protein [Microthrixaceae bacterium]|nr:YlxR family protein [Microthrixaceae bacterium]
MGCRTRRHPDELVRVAIVDGRILIGRTAGGRGAWLCPNPQCIDSAAKRRALTRALRTQVPPEAYETLRRAVDDEPAFSSHPPFVKR